MLKNIILVGLGSSIGGVLRYAISLMVKSTNFPYATLMVNILGSFVIGIIFALGIKNQTNQEQIKLFFATGICGGFTTLSAFSLENMELLKSENYTIAFLYIAATIILSITAVFAGYKIINF
jgi:fluoride exporter